MKNAALSSIALTSFVLMSMSGFAHAQGDHLKCYKMKDALNLRGVINLDALEFSPATECTVAKAGLFCIPAESSVIEAFDKEGAINPLPVDGQDLVDDRICYKIKCARQPSHELTIDDQFAARSIEQKRAAILCSPAQRDPAQQKPPPPTPDDHLRCYKVKDPLKLRGTIALSNAQVGVDGVCTISKAKLYCEPTSVLVRQAFVRRKQILTPLALGGQALSDSRFACYKLKCPKPFPDDRSEVDEFGARQIEKLVPSLVCSPLQPTSPTVRTTEDTNPVDLATEVELLQYGYVRTELINFPETPPEHLNDGAHDLMEETNWTSIVVDLSPGENYEVAVDVTETSVVFAQVHWFGSETPLEMVVSRAGSVLVSGEVEFEPPDRGFIRAGLDDVAVGVLSVRVTNNTIAAVTVQGFVGSLALSYLE